MELPYQGPKSTFTPRRNLYLRYIEIGLLWSQHICMQTWGGSGSEGRISEYCFKIQSRLTLVSQILDMLKSLAQSKHPANHKDVEEYLQGS